MEKLVSGGLCILLLSSQLVVYGSLSGSPFSLHSNRLISKRQHLLLTNDETNQEQINLGTTIVAIQYKDGIVVGADTRTSVSSSYVSHRYATKIIKITDTCVVCRSGSSADTQMIAQSLYQYTMNNYYQNNCINYLSIEQMSNWLRRQIVSMKDQYGDANELRMSLMVTGYDIATQKPRIYSIAPSGALWQEYDFAVSGSGSTYIIAYLDNYFQIQQKRIKNKKMKDQQPMEDDTTSSTQASYSGLEEGDAIQLCAKSIQMAIDRDASSGGTISLYIINADGIKPVTILPPSSTLLTTTTTTKQLPGFANRLVE
jgi:20S proteasome subunit beta 1